MKKAKKHKKAKSTEVHALLGKHFGKRRLDELTTSTRVFPATARVDLQVALGELLTAKYTVAKLVGVHRKWSHDTLNFPQLVTPGAYAAVVGPLQYEEEDLGNEQSVRCLKTGLWLCAEGKEPFAVLAAPVKRYDDGGGVHLEIAVAPGETGAEMAQRFLRELEERVCRAGTYRGKVLSLEAESDYRGRAAGLRVHKVRAVSREEVILPEKTLALLERNILRFTSQRPRLRALNLPVKKGLLFYGPPGVGKTHTIHYLAGALSGHTTLLITAGQVGLLGEYMQLARFLQPAVVVIEDADLIARDREDMHNVCEEALLNKLLNEMDGLREDAEIFFILTTNRPEALEAALKSRPGRIDQAIEFPLPDEVGRRKLVQLYARGLALTDGLADTIVRRTERGSAALIKELMRRSAQFALESGRDSELQLADIEGALEEMLFSGGSLNATLLGMSGSGEET